MELSKEQVAHIAKLARLKISDEEAGKFSGQLTDILQYVEVLNEVETEGVEITAQVTDLQNMTRADKVKEVEEPTPKELLDCSPNPVELNQIKVHASIK
jgi:aspartyl-tRNA(Asn)/glutamyl-tRNA(Gln) amidotransferase subunit C